MRSRALRAASVHSRLAVVLAPILMALPVHSLLALILMALSVRQVRSRLAVRMAPLPVRLRLAAVMALILLERVRPVRSPLEVRLLARVRLLQQADSLALPLRAQSMLLVLARRRRSARLGSSNLALRRLPRLSRCHRRALPAPVVRLARPHRLPCPGESNCRRFPHSWRAPKTTATSSAC
jgi:hypothetical protein